MNFDFSHPVSDDQVYIQDEAERKEYILNETGRLYVGSKKRIFSRPWNFGQFERPSLEAALTLLEKCYLATEGHGNPTRLTRALSAMVCKFKSLFVIYSS